MNKNILHKKDRKEIERGESVRNMDALRRYIAALIAPPPMPGMEQQAGGMMPPQMNAPMRTLDQQSPYLEPDDTYPWQSAAQIGMNPQEREEWRMQQLLKQILISQITGEPMPAMNFPAVDYPNAPEGSQRTPLGPMPGIWGE